MRLDILLNAQQLRRRRRGAALVMVLISVVILTVFTVELQQQSSASFSSALAARHRLQAEYHARSAINLSRLLIATEPSIRKTIAVPYSLLMKGKKPPQIPVWAFSDQMLGVFNGGERATGFAELTGTDLSSAENIGLAGAGHFELIVVDEDSKININEAVRGDPITLQRLGTQLLGLLAGPQYDILFDSLDSDGQQSDRQTICSALLDWADSDENIASCLPQHDGGVSQGSEDNFYQTIGLPYLRKNAGYDSLEELRMVRGMSDDFWATFVDPDPSDPRKRNLSVWGQGKVNVNTANAQTILAIACSYAKPNQALCTDLQQMTTFLGMVSMIRQFGNGVPVFSSGKEFIKTLKGGSMLGPALTSMGVEPLEFENERELRSVIDTKSKVFSIYAEGVVPGQFGTETRVPIHAVVDFRQASELPAAVDQAALADFLAGGAGADKSGGDSDAVGADPTDPNDPAAVLAALAQDPAGQVVYYRID